MKFSELIKNKNVVIGMSVLVGGSIVAYLTRNYWMKSYAKLHTDVDFNNDTVKPTFYLQGAKFELPVFNLNSVTSQPYYMDYEVNGHVFSILIVAKTTSDKSFLTVAALSCPVKEITSEEVMKKHLLVGSLIDFEDEQVIDMAKYFKTNVISDVSEGNF